MCANALEVSFMRKQKQISIIALICIMTILLVCGCGNSASKQQADAGSKYPEKDITLIIPFTAGGSSDVQARIVEKYFKDEFGVNLVFTYKEGAGGEVGWTELANTEPDGYTIAGFNDPHILLQPLARETAFTYESFDYIGLMVQEPQLIVVSKDSPYNTFEELLDAIKQNPGKLTCGLSGSYSGHHITALKLMDVAGCNFTLVPYNGSADQIVALQGGHIDFIVGNPGDLTPDAEKYKFLAIADEERASYLPDVPTLIELGYDVTNHISRGFATPAGVDPEILARLQEGFENIANNPEYLKDMEAIGQLADWTNGKELKALFEEESKEFQTLLEKYDTE